MGKTLHDVGNLIGGIGQPCQVDRHLLLAVSGQVSQGRRQDLLGSSAYGGAQLRETCHGDVALAAFVPAHSRGLESTAAGSQQAAKGQPRFLTGFAYCVAEGLSKTFQDLSLRILGKESPRLTAWMVAV
jgi:hypothetical protein